MKPKRKEFLVIGDSESKAIDKLMMAVFKYIARVKMWRFVVNPDALKYEGKSKKLKGKWRAYARIEFIK